MSISAWKQNPNHYFGYPKFWFGSFCLIQSRIVNFDAEGLQILIRILLMFFWHTNGNWNIINIPLDKPYSKLIGFQKISDYNQCLRKKKKELKYPNI